MDYKLREIKNPQHFVSLSPVNMLVGVRRCHTNNPYSSWDAQGIVGGVKCSSSIVGTSRFKTINSI